MTRYEHHGSSGIGFVGLLQVVFITLKLCGVIHWTWLWVLSPMWVCVLANIAVMIGGALYLLWLHMRHQRELEAVREHLRSMDGMWSPQDAAEDSGPDAPGQRTAGQDVGMDASQEASQGWPGREVGCEQDARPDG